MEDEEVAESWEEAADSGEIERRLEASMKIREKSKKQSDGSGSFAVRTAVVIPDESLPAAPPPQIRILKRPSSNGTLSSLASSARPTPQVKSLAQREAEYAEARRRILGSASPEEMPSDGAMRVNSPGSLEQVHPGNCAIRQPMGPDGTQGFRKCR
ncbi:SUZ domain-containing protein 1-like [Denticeps clupeoides]|uniref:SUZ RNA-binding domain-containing n=1 Tax=Denticeps clupeoides TaxID=299321 RepID=A0AAY4AYZ1_9TELE|nr:SUZ domain-containing protein 1-like [Denticeps clupeoides]